MTNFDQMFLAEVDVHHRYCDPEFVTPLLIHRLGSICKSKYIHFSVEEP